MKKLHLLLIVLMISLHAEAQFSLSGKITDSKTGSPLPGATVTLEENYTGAAANENGLFSIRQLKAGNYHLAVRFLGYREYKLPVSLFRDTVVDISLEPSVVSAGEVVITATRASEKSGMAVSAISKQEIENVNTGRDLPFLLEGIPSLVTTSDAGTGIGYTGLRIRGSDQTRINVTIDGIPINDPESHLLYWVNMPDLASSVENIQVQRGVGTSTNGASAFGGSIHIKTNDPSEKPYLNASAAYGSFNTLKTTASIGTGMLHDKFNFEGRLSKISSDGYVDRASADLKSFFIAGGYYGSRDVLRMNIFSGKEVTYQSWYGVPQAALDTNRTWNYYTYDNQVDDYQQDHYQLFYTRKFSGKVSLNTAFHYTYGRGYYEEYNENESLSDYQLDPVLTGNDTITETDLIRRKWLDNDFYGVTWSLIAKPNHKTDFILGGAWNQYDGDHFGEVIWAQFASNGNIRHRYYDNNGFKTDFNVYAKGTISLTSQLSVYADLQYRNVSYDFTGIGSDGNPLPQNASLDFFNPKAGMTWNFSPGQDIYSSFSVGNKEPSRDDYVETTGNSRPEPERLYDLEVGYKSVRKKWKASLNYYYMWYHNQLALTGQINDVGNYTRTNIESSFREGIEAEFGWNPVQKFNVSGNVTLSRNKIKEFREYTDDFDNGGQVLTIYRNTDLSFSPSLTGFLTLNAKITRKIEAAFVSRYIGKQYLDNTANSQKSIEPYLTSDIRLNIRLKPKFMKDVHFTLMLNNLFDVEYESNGYTFSYISGGERISENYYYPQAKRNFMAQLRLEF
jgi:iron complex outermembrane receptor protein